MKLVKATTPRTDISFSQLNTSQNVSISTSFLQIQSLADINGYPTADWYFIRFGTTGNQLLAQGIQQIGAAREFEIATLCYVPPNLDFSNLTNGNRHLLFSNFNDTRGFRVDVRLGRLWIENTPSGDVDTGFDIQSNNLYHFVLRVRGQTSRTSNDGYASFWVNGVEVYSESDYNWSTSSDPRARLEDGTHFHFWSGPNDSYGCYFRDMVILEGFSTPQADPPDFFRVDVAPLGSVNPETTYTGADVPTLTDITDSTFASGPNSNDVLSLDFNTPDVLGLDLIGAYVWLDKTKITLENAEVTATLKLQDDSFSATDTFLETTTDSFNNRYIAFDMEGNVNNSNVNLKIVATDVT